VNPRVACHSWGRDPPHIWPQQQARAPSYRRQAPQTLETSIGFILEDKKGTVQRTGPQFVFTLANLACDLHQVTRYFFLMSPLE
jgi:hypothetical protein